MSRRRTVEPHETLRAYWWGVDRLANTKLGRKVGDYIGVTFSSGKAFSAVAVPRPTTAAACDEAIYTTTNPLIQDPVVAAVGREQLVQRAHSDHPPRQFYDLEGRYPRNPPH